MITIHEKIIALRKRSDQQLRTAQNSARQGDFGSATSLLVTAFEERTKAVVLQIVELGYPIVNDFSDLEYIFRQHDARHYIGFFVDCLYEIIDDFKVILERCMHDKNYLFRIAKFTDDEDIQKDLLQWALVKIASFLNKVDFYQNIEQTRQNGLYVDVLNHRYTGMELNEEDYLFVKSRLAKVHMLSKDLIEMTQLDELDLLPALEDSKQKISQSNIPSHLVTAIKLVKKERSKAFNSIRKKLIGVREELIKQDINSTNL